MHPSPWILSMKNCTQLVYDLINFTFTRISHPFLKGRTVLLLRTSSPCMAYDVESLLRKSFCFVRSPESLHAHSLRCGSGWDFFHWFGKYASLSFWRRTGAATTICVNAANQGRVGHIIREKSGVHLSSLLVVVVDTW